MRTYVFRCPKCKKDHEKRQKKPPKRYLCPLCMTPCERIIVFPSGGISFKGKGFYSTDK